MDEGYVDDQGMCRENSQPQNEVSQFLKKLETNIANRIFKLLQNGSDDRVRELRRQLRLRQEEMQRLRALAARERELRHEYMAFLFNQLSRQHE